MKQFYPFLFLVFISGLSLGQQDTQYSLYRQHLNMINPAVSGSKELPEINMTFRSQWSGIQGAPETQVISFGTPTKNDRVGIGFSVINDRTFVEKQTQLFASFSYRLPMSESTDLFLGLQAGANSFRVNAQGLKYYGSLTEDPNLIDYSRFNPNIGVGLYLKNERYYVSLSSPKILNSERYKDQDGMVTTAADRVHLYASAGYFFNLNDRWKLIPSFFVRQVQNAPLLLTANTSFSYKNTLDFGVEYNFDSGLGGTFMLNTSKTFSFGYAYVASNHKAISQFSTGTHEAVVNIKLGDTQNNNDRLERKIGLRKNRTTKK